jgi:hypothetical protein
MIFEGKDRFRTCFKASMAQHESAQSEVSRIVGQNIDALIRMRQAHEKEKSRQDRFVGLALLASNLERLSGILRKMFRPKWFSIKLRSSKKSMKPNTKKITRRKRSDRFSQVFQNAVSEF